MLPITLTDKHFVIKHTLDSIFFLFIDNKCLSDLICDSAKGGLKLESICIKTFCHKPFLHY